MPVERFRDVRDMPPPARVIGARLLDAIAGVWDWAHVRGSPPIERGVRRFRTVEEAAAARHEADIARMRALARSG